MLSTWDGRNGFDGSGGGWPIRVGLDRRERLLRRHPGPDRPQHASGQWIPVARRASATSTATASTTTRPAASPATDTQEFVADTFGAATEWYANNPIDTPDFTVGETVNLVGSGPIRYMYNPSLAGDDNCYSSSIPTEEVHAAAGPGNHWFYLLAEGTSPTNGQPTSPTCNSTSVTGVGIQKAEQIMYNAMLMKTSTSSYLKYRTWTLTAAKNLDPTLRARSTPSRPRGTPSRVPAQTGDPTCTTGGTNTVTVTNPGAQTGTVGTAKSLQLTGTDSASGQTLHLVGDRPPDRPVDQRLDRPGQRDADHGGHVQLDGDRQGHDRRDRLDHVHVDDRRRRWRRLHQPRPEARQPRLRDRHGGALDGVGRRDRQLDRRAGTRRQLEGLAGRLRHHPHRHAHASR